MPGLSFIYTGDGSLDSQYQRTLSSLDSLLHFGSYQREILLHTSSYLLACTRYKEYPIHVVDTETFFICVEGKIYGANESMLADELKQLAAHIFSGPADRKDLLKEWLITTNGEFNLFVLNKESYELGILSDALGHLPIYYCSLENMFLLSREIRFITALLREVKFDKTALMQYLLFCYPLGNRSLLENVFRLGANGFVHIDLNRGDISIRTLFEHNFQEKQHATESLQANARNLVDILTEQCKAVPRSLEGFGNVLALSGGFDSRIVMLAMRQAGVPFHAATRLDSGETSERDVDVARQLTKLYQLDWRLFELQPPTFTDALKLLQMKSGLNYLGMAFILPFLQWIRDHYGGKMIYWTGDTGLVIRRECPDERLRNYDDLVDCILREHQIFDPHDVARLLKIDVNSIREDIKNVLEAYPEQSLPQKFVHFVMYGRTMNWHYEGMDRNRCFFWACAPLEFTSVVNYAMNCPDTQKSHFKLYRAIIEILSKEACGVVHAEHGLALESILFPVVAKMQSVVQKMPRGVRSLLKAATGRKGRGPEAKSLTAQCISRQLKTCSILSEYLSTEYAEHLLVRSNALQRNVFITVTSLIEELTSHKSCFDDYRQDDFS